MSGFFVQIWLSKYFMSTIKLDVLFCYFICARIMDVHTESVCPNTHYFIRMLWLFVVYKMASNVNAEMAFLRVLLLRRRHRRFFIGHSISVAASLDRLTAIRRADAVT